MDIETHLKWQEIEVNQQHEVDRIHETHPKDFYALLNVSPSASASEIKKKYRQLAVLLHPDKAKGERAANAFELVKKAELALMDNDTQSKPFQERARLQEIYKHNSDRKFIAKELDRLAAEEELQRQLLQKQKHNDEVMEQKVQLERQAEVNHKKKWENDRDERISSWRSYVSKVEKPKKKKKKTLA